MRRKFHVTVVENHSEREFKRASWMFPLYLVLSNSFVVPIATAGLVLLRPGTFEPDIYGLALPMAQSSNAIARIAYIDSLSGNLE